MVKIVYSEEDSRRIANNIITAIRTDPWRFDLFTRLLRFAGSRGEANPTVAAKALRDAASIYESGYPKRAAAAIGFAEGIERQAKSARRR
ncbi:hypothetical protein M1394_01010 [Candidatus Marsarchaeota archaeon]|nr:hypothetical protein [Candidatus Marsarchaeota archaeon]